MDHQLEHHLDLWSSVAIPYFNFFVFLAAFLFFFRKTLGNMATNRRQQFLAASKEAQAALESAQKAFSEVKNRLSQLDADLDAFKAQSEASARAESTRLLEETAKLAEQIKSETSKLAETAIESAKLELRKEIVDAAKQRVAERITKDLDNSKKQAILQSKIKEVATLTIQ